MTRVKDYHGRVITEFQAAYNGDANALEEYLLSLDGDQDGINDGAEKILWHTSVHFACYGKSNPQCIELLKQHGANIFKRDLYGRLPLHVAANSGKLDILTYLIEQHEHKDSLIAVNVLDFQHRSVIHAICCTCSSPHEKANPEELEKSLRLLLSKFSEPCAALLAKDHYGYTPIDLAISSGCYTALEKVFKEHDINPDLYYDRAEEIPPKRWDFFHRSLLMHAVSGVNVNEVQKLLATENINETNSFLGARSVLHFATNKNSNPEILALLLNNDDINIVHQDDFGSNVLHFAANSGILDFVNIVLEKFPAEHLNDQDHKGRTALHALEMSLNCAQEVKQAIKKVLIDKGVDSSIKDNNGQKAFALLRRHSLRL